MIKKPCVLIIRPQPEADRFGEVLTSCGYDIFIEPVLNVKPVDYAIPDFSKYSGLLFTSGNAVRAMAGSGVILDDDIPVYCVGDQTALEAAKIFRNVLSAQGAEVDLVQLIKASKRRADSLLYVRGRIIHGDLAAVLGQEGMSCDSLVVYDAVPTRSFSDDLNHHIYEKSISVIPFFSARTARVFLDLSAQQGLSDRLTSIKFLCLSEAVLKSVPLDLRDQAYISEKPTQASMIELIKQHIPLNV